MSLHHRVHFPPADAQNLDQDEVSFLLREASGETRLRFHDYDEIYKRPGLYEQLFYDRLKCNSPAKVAETLQKTLAANGEQFTELRVLDLGAGNGIMGEAVKRIGVSRLIGVDIIPEARDACLRDRPGLYDEYYIADFTALDDDTETEIDAWSIDCLAAVAALGFGDIPPKAFLRAIQFVANGGWVAFNIKETFLDNSDTSGFSKFIRELIFSEYLNVHHLERYRHRLSMEGTPLYYYALVARKVADIPSSFVSASV